MKTLADIIQEIRAEQESSSMGRNIALEMAGIDTTVPGDWKKTLGWSLAKGAIAGLGSLWDRAEKRKVNETLATLLPQVVAGNELVKPSNVDSDLYDRLLPELKVFQLNRNLQRQDIDDEIYKRKRLLEEEDRILAERERREEERKQKEREEKRRIYETFAKPLINTNDYITETTEDKIRAATARMLTMDPDLSPAQAQIQARQLFAHELDDNKKELQSIREQRIKTDQLERLAAEGAEAASKATHTGRFGETLQTLKGISSIPVLEGLFPQSLKDEFRAGERLQTLKGDIISAAREAGTGHMSDRDVLNYLQSQMGLHYTPETNLQLAERARQIAKRKRDYETFANSLISKGVSAIDVSILYDKYNKEYPPFLYDDAGMPIKYNQSRPTPLEWISGNVQKREDSKTVTSQIPKVGELFNGKEVVSVRKIK